MKKSLKYCLTEDDNDNSSYWKNFALIIFMIILLGLCVIFENGKKEKKENIEEQITASQPVEEK